MKMGKKHDTVHKAFLGLKRPLDATQVYETMCKLLKLGEEAVERGIGRLYKDGKLKRDDGEKRPRKSKNSGGRDRGRAPDPAEFQ